LNRLVYQRLWLNTLSIRNNRACLLILPFLVQ
jgi:hypothetical protein